MVMKERNNDAVKNWKPNASAPLWDEESENEPKGPFFTDLDIKHIKQVGPSCVPTTLSNAGKKYRCRCGS